MHEYSAFGLRIHCADPLPGLQRADAATSAASDGAAMASAAAAVEVHLAPPPPAIRAAERVPHFASERHDEGPPALQVWSLAGEGTLLLEYAEGVRFHVTTDGRRVWCEWDVPLTIADVMTFLVGPVLGYVLRRRGVVALHASAPVIDGRAVGLVGPGGAGKSTLAAAFAQRGHPLLGDDILALREGGEGWEALPAVGEVRLWEESERLLFGDGSVLPTLTPSWPKRGLVLADAGFTFQRDPVPLGLLLLLDERRTEGPPSSNSLRGAAAIVGLVANSYTNYLLDAEGRAAELRAVGRLVGGVRVLRFAAAADPARMGENLEAIERLVRGH